MVPSHRTHSFVVHHHVVAIGGLDGIVHILLENGAVNQIRQTTIAAAVLRKSLPTTYYFPIIADERSHRRKSLPSTVVGLRIAGPFRESPG